MAFRCLRVIKNIRCSGINSSLNSHIKLKSVISTSSVISKYNLVERKELKTENNKSYLEDPDTFGTLSRNSYRVNIEKEDEGDRREEKYLEQLPLQSQKLTIRQYADIMKQYIQHKRLKEALDVLEVRMLHEDRVKPDNYIYNILIGACADVGYTKKAFKLFNDMKKRALKPTGDTYTCLFTACLNSPWVADGLKNARHLRALMIEKGVEPNLTNYNVMIKAFGRCGDLPTAFQIVDEMIGKKIKIRVHTFNHLLHACITDKENGLRHSLVVWRKMLKMREKPNIYSFNLMLKCVKDCNLGSKEDINNLISILEEHIVLTTGVVHKPLQIEAARTEALIQEQKFIRSSLNNIQITDSPIKRETIKNNDASTKVTDNQEIIVVEDQESITMDLVQYKKNVQQVQTKRTVPNLLSRTLQMDRVFALQDVSTLQDKFAVVGGHEDFLKEMEVYSVLPDIKIFTQMLPLIANSTEAELELLQAMKSAKVKPDIDFYNLLIRKRCLRLDYEKALEVKDMIKEDKKKRNPLIKKHRLKENIMTYGVLALACKTRVEAAKLLEEMKEKQIKVNIQILGTLLKHGTVQTQFEYVKYVMDIVREEQVVVNSMFLQHLEEFNDKCANIIKQNEEKGAVNKGFAHSYNRFLYYYKEWLEENNAKKGLKPEHPWQQFNEPYPETIQRQPFEIKQPKKFYKRNRKFVKYVPQVK